MKNRVTICTNWNQIFYRIQYILRTHFCKRHNMMNMNVTLTNCPIEFSEIKLTYRTFAAMVIYTYLASFKAPLIDINRNSLRCPLSKPAWRYYFFSKYTIESTIRSVPLTNSRYETHFL